MKTDITDLMLYGSWDEEDDVFPDDATWFEKSSCDYFHTDILIDEYGYDSYEDIAESGFFIPVFRTNVTALMKSFAKSYEDKSAVVEIQRIIDDEDEEYGVAFRIYAEVHPDFLQAYNKYEDEVLEADSRKWAEENGVDFFGEWDSDSKIVFDILSACFYYEENSVPGYTRWWFSKKDYSTIDQFAINKKLDSGELTKEELERDYILIPAVTEAQANEAGKDWDDYVDEVAKRWCEENGIRWYIPTHIPDHIKK